jgi:hypothetical protein
VVLDRCLSSFKVDADKLADLAEDTIEIPQSTRGRHYSTMAVDKGRYRHSRPRGPQGRRRSRSKRLAAAVVTVTAVTASRELAATANDGHASGSAAAATGAGTATAAQCQRDGNDSPTVAGAMRVTGPPAAGLQRDVAPRHLIGPEYSDDVDPRVWGQLDEHSDRYHSDQELFLRHRRRHPLRDAGAAATTLDSPPIDSDARWHGAWPVDELVEDLAAATLLSSAQSLPPPLLLDATHGGMVAAGSALQSACTDGIDAAAPTLVSRERMRRSGPPQPPGGAAPRQPASPLLPPTAVRASGDGPMPTGQSPSRQAVESAATPPTRPPLFQRLSRDGHCATPAAAADGTPHTDGEGSRVSLPIHELGIRDSVADGVTAGTPWPTESAWLADPTGMASESARGTAGEIGVGVFPDGRLSPPLRRDVEVAGL